MIIGIIFNILGGIAICHKTNFGYNEDFKETTTIHYCNETVQANLNSTKVNNGIAGTDFIKLIIGGVLIACFIAAAVKFPKEKEFEYKEYDAMANLISLIMSHDRNDHKKALIIAENGIDPFKFDSRGNSAFSIALEVENKYLVKKFFKLSNRNINEHKKLKDSLKSYNLLLLYLAKNLYNEQSNLVEFFKWKKDSPDKEKMFISLFYACEDLGEDISDFFP